MNEPSLCSTCRWFRREVADDGTPSDEGTCHARPPMPDLKDEGRGIWPWVDVTDFCARWTPVKLTLGVRIRAHTADRLARRKVRAKVRL